MNGQRFIALVATDPGARSAWEQASAHALYARPGLEKQLAGDRLALVAQAGAALAIGREGFLIGNIYERGRTHALSAIAADAARSVVSSRGSWLINAHWGSYVALIAARDRDCIEIIRAPFGTLGCYMWQSPHGLALASDVDLLRAFAGYAPQVDWTALARQLIAGDLFGRRTCLDGLDELSGGERLIDHAGHQRVEQLWSPWNFVAADKRIDDPAEARRRVGDTVQTAVAALAMPHDKIVLRLSGGLDSSIVAACLARARRQVVALTMVTRHRAGDERAHARAVADHLGISLIEATRDTELVDLTASEANGLPRPCARAFAQATTRAAGDVALNHAATAIFDGGGGDNVFASLQSLAPVADCLASNGGTGHFWRTARSIGIAGATGTVAVARRALLRKWTRGPAYRWPSDLALLSRDARASGGNAAVHPWLVTAGDALPGSAAHIALLIGAQSVAQSRDPRAAVASISPLIAQPVAEACLRVPSWLWTRDGHDRVIARDAFRDALPTAIVDRRDKGSPDSFLIELIEANASLVCAMLMEGVLADHGLLDRAAVAEALEPASLVKGFGHVRLMQLIDAEAWARSWARNGMGDA